MLRLMQSELRLMLGIIPLPHQKAVLSIILRDSLEMIYHDAEVWFIFCILKRCANYFTHINNIFYFFICSLEFKWTCKTQRHQTRLWTCTPYFSSFAALSLSKK